MVMSAIFNTPSINWLLTTF